MTHSEVVACAVKWLKKQDCKVYFSEPRFEGHRYSPDALGWKWRTRIRPNTAVSILVECKVSKSDFAADRHKMIHDIEASVDHPGDLRYFMVPESLRINVAKVPQGWGLIEVGLRGRCNVVLDATDHFLLNGRTKNPRIALAEQAFLLSALRRTFFDVHFDTDTGRFETVTDNMKRKAKDRLQVILNERLIS